MSATQSNHSIRIYPTLSGKRTAVVTERRCPCCGGAGETLAGAVCGACRGRGSVRKHERGEARYADNGQIAAVYLGQTDDGFAEFVTWGL